MVTLPVNAMARGITPCDGDIYAVIALVPIRPVSVLDLLAVVARFSGLTSCFTMHESSIHGDG